MTSKTYAEKMVERCSQMIVEALQNLSIEDINMYQIGYEKGKADKEKELQGLKDLGALYSEIRADERARLYEQIEKLREGRLDLARLGGDTTLALGYCRAMSDVSVMLAEGIKEQSNE